MQRPFKVYFYTNLSEPGKGCHSSEGEGSEAKSERGSLSLWHVSAKREETKAKVEKMITRPAVLRPWKENSKCRRLENGEATTVAR